MADFQAEYIMGRTTNVPHTPGSALAAGEVVVVGSVPMISPVDFDPATQKGVHALSAGNSGAVYRCEPAAAIAAGLPVWWDDANNVVTATPSGNRHFGYTVSASYEGDTLVDVMHAPQGLVGAIA